MESNFPKHKEKFKTYSQLPAYVIAELRDDNLSTYEITWTMFKNDVDRDEVEISFKKNKSAFNRQDLTVSTRKGTKPLKETHGVLHTLFYVHNPKSKGITQDWVYRTLKEDFEESESLK